MARRVSAEPQLQLSEALSEPRIVLAIDYGTTFTGSCTVSLWQTDLKYDPGLAWMQTTGDRLPRFEDLHLFRQWPERNEAKVPSEISYSIASRNDDGHVFRQWGYSIETGCKVLRWTKLELVRNRSLLEELEVLNELVNGLHEVNELHNDTDGAASVPRHLSKTTEDIIEAYLSSVAREWKNFITSQGEFVLNRVPVDIVVTHPAV